MTNETIPSTPQELIRQNQEPLSPETVWDEFHKLSVSDKEVFIWNCVSQMRNFHFFVVDEMMKDEECPKERLMSWVQDGTKWNELLRILHGMDINSNNDE